MTVSWSFRRLSGPFEGGSGVSRRLSDAFQRGVEGVSGGLRGILGGFEGRSREFPKAFQGFRGVQTVHAALGSFTGVTGGLRRFS